MAADVSEYIMSTTVLRFMRADFKDIIANRLHA